MAAKNNHGGHQLDLTGVARDARLQKQDPVPASSGRGSRDRFAAEHRLTRGVLHVHDRRLAGDGDRFGERADLQLRVHRDRAGPGQFEAFAFHRTESGQREGDRITPRPEVHDLVLARVVGDDRPHLLNQGRARGLNGDARQHPTGCILHNAGQRRLSVRRCRPQEHERRQQNPRSRPFRHWRTPSLLLLVVHGHGADADGRRPQWPGRCKALVTLSALASFVKKHLARQS